MFNYRLPDRVYTSQHTCRNCIFCAGESGKWQFNVLFFFVLILLTVCVCNSLTTTVELLSLGDFHLIFAFHLNTGDTLHLSQRGVCAIRNPQSAVVNISAVAQSQPQSQPWVNELTRVATKNLYMYIILYKQFAHTHTHKQGVCVCEWSLRPNSCCLKLKLVENESRVLFLFSVVVFVTCAFYLFLYLFFSLSIVIVVVVVVVLFVSPFVLLSLLCNRRLM